MKKPKRPRPVAKRPPPPVILPTAPERGVWGILKKLGVVGGALGLLLTTLHFWPEISIEPTLATEASNPFSGFFKIKNEQVYPLTDVGIEVSLRCGRIGLGDNTSPMANCLPSMRTSKHLWTNHTLEPHEPY